MNIFWAHSLRLPVVRPITKGVFLFSSWLSGWCFGWRCFQVYSAFCHLYMEYSKHMDLRWGYESNVFREVDWESLSIRLIKDTTERYLHWWSTTCIPIAWTSFWAKTLLHCKLCFEHVQSNTYSVFWNKWLKNWINYLKFKDSNETRVFKNKKKIFLNL